MMQKKNSYTEKLMERFSQQIIKRGAKWPPDCGALVYQPERPRVSLENAFTGKEKKD